MEANNDRRRADSDAVIRNVASHNRIRTNHAALPYTDIWKYDTTDAEEGTFADFDESFIILNASPDFCGVWEIVERVRRIDDGAVRRHRNIVFNDYAVMTNGIHVLFDANIVANSQLGRIQGVEHDDFKASAWANVHVLTYVDMLRLRKGDGTETIDSPFLSCQKSADSKVSISTLSQVK